MAWFAVHLDSTAVRVNDILDDLGPQSSTSGLSTHDLVREQTITNLWGHSGASVNYGNAYHPGVSHALASYGN